MQINLPEHLGSVMRQGLTDEVQMSKNFIGISRNTFSRLT